MDYLGERGAAGGFGLECQAHADDFERVGEKDGDDARDGAGCEAPARGLFGAVGDEEGANLLVREEFDAAVGEDAE